MDLKLKGKHVLVTGGTRGIGRACARAFLAEGAIVSIIGRSEENLRLAIEHLDAPASLSGFHCDLADAQAAASMVARVWEQNAPIDVLVNAAGAAQRTPFEELSPQTYANAMTAKFQTYVNVFDPVIKRMGDRGEGAIVNIVGMGGKVAATTHVGGGAANAALMLASAGLAAAYAPKGVRVNVVNPALTLTDRLKEGLSAEARAKGISEEEAFIQAKARFPLGRIATPEDVADAVLFLASPRAAYISGVALSVDGASTPLVV